jgi:hypothetical protein
MNQKAYALLYKDFKMYDKILFGKPIIIFYQEPALESMSRYPISTDKHHRYLNIVKQSEKAKDGYQRLAE